MKRLQGYRLRLEPTAAEEALLRAGASEPALSSRDRCTPLPVEGGADRDGDRQIDRVAAQYEIAKPSEYLSLSPEADCGAGLFHPDRRARIRTGNELIDRRGHHATDDRRDPEEP
jgi:hypothetical protein